MRFLIKPLCIILIMLPLSFAKADADKKLTIATYDSFTADWGIGPVIKKNMEQTCDCTIKYKSYSSSLALVAALKANQLNDVDVILGFDQITYQLHPFIKEELAEHDVKKYNVFGDDNVLAYDYGTISLVTRDDVFSTLPTSWDALLRDAEDSSIILIDPRSSTVGQALLLDMALYFGDGLDAFLQKFKRKVLTVSQGWSIAYALFTEQEGNVVLSYTTSPSYHRLIEDDATKQAIIHDAGHVRQIELMGILKHSNQQELAKKFVRYMLSSDAQQHIPTMQWMFPVNPGVALPDNYLVHQEPTYYDTNNIKETLEQALTTFSKYF